MNILLIVLVAIVALWICCKLVLRLVWRFAAAHPALVQASDDYQRKRDAEQATLEVASWIGLSGLPEAIEREMPHYLRREFGEFLEDGGLKADDLKYIGKFKEAPGMVYYWQIPSSKTEPLFAYVEVDDRDGSHCLGWGNKQAPEAGRYQG